jgi:hypothetical protein
MRKKGFHKFAISIGIVICVLALGGMIIVTSAPQASGNGAPSVVSYQGQVILSGSPYNGTGYFKFAVVDAAGSTSYWSNDGTSTAGGEPTSSVGLTVSTGLFNVLLGDTALSGMTQALTADVFDGVDRWMRVWFSSDNSVFQLLSPDQHIAAVPYALQAQSAADANTLGGFGVSAFQRLISNSCEVGSTIRTINPDGSVVCESHDTRPGFSRNTVDRSAITFSSINIGVDGLPVISYRQNSYPYNLMIAHCGDKSCNSVNAITPLDNVEIWYTSITIGADGLPVISYHDNTNENLKVAHCGNPNCTVGNAITTVDSSARVGSYNAITIGVDGLPVISYYDVTNKNLKVVHCGDAACSAGNTITVVDSGATGYSTSIAIGVDGLPIISYKKWGSPQALKVAHCLDITCSTSNITTVDSTGGISGTSITICADGLPVISYFKESSENYILQTAKCQTIDCSGSSIISSHDTVDPGSRPGISITVGHDSLPIISYYDSNDGDLKVAKCCDEDCLTTTKTTVDATGDVGMYNAITIGTDGMPVISYHDLTNHNLNIVYCSNEFCLPYWRRR